MKSRQVKYITGYLSKYMKEVALRKKCQSVSVSSVTVVIRECDVSLENVSLLIRLRKNCATIVYVIGLLCQK